MQDLAREGTVFDDEFVLRSSRKTTSGDHPDSVADKVEKAKTRNWPVR